MTEIRETYAAWRDRVLESHPGATIHVQHRDRIPVIASASIGGIDVTDQWQSNDPWYLKALAADAEVAA